MSLQGSMITFIKYYNYHIISMLALKFKSILFTEDMPDYVIYIMIGFGGLGKILGSIVLGKISKNNKIKSLNISLLLGMLSLLIFISLGSKSYLSIALFIFARLLFNMSMSGGVDTARILSFNSGGNYKAFFLSTISLSSKIGIMIGYLVLFLLEINDLYLHFWKLALVFSIILYIMFYFIYYENIYSIVKIFCIEFYNEIIKLNFIRNIKYIKEDKIKILLSILLAGFVGSISQFDLILLPKLFKTHYFISNQEAHYMAVCMSFISCLSSIFVGLLIDVSKNALLIFGIGIFFYSLLIVALNLLGYSKIIYLMFGVFDSFLIIGGMYILILLSKENVGYFSISHSLGSVSLSAFTVALLSYINEHYGLFIMYTFMNISLIIFLLVFWYLYKFFIDDSDK